MRLGSSIPGRGARWGTPAAALLAAAAGLLAGCQEPVVREAGWTALGAPAEARVRTLTGAGAEDLLAELRRATERVEALVGPGEATPLAELQRAAAQGFHPIDDRDLYRMVLLGLDYARASEGLYDPTLGAVRGAPPAQRAARLAHTGWQDVTVASEARSVRFRDPELALDLDGLDRGLAIDVAARRFATPGVHGALLRVGNVRYAWGEPPEGERWRVTVTDPRAPDEPLLAVVVDTRAIAACGVPWSPAAGGRPVLDPATGEPPAGDTAVAVAIAHSGMDAAALCRVLLVGGRTRGGAFLERTRNAEGVLVTEVDGAPEVLASATLHGRLEMAGELAGAPLRYLLPPVPGRDRPDAERVAPLVH